MVRDEANTVLQAYRLRWNSMELSVDIAGWYYLKHDSWSFPADCPNPITTITMDSFYHRISQAAVLLLSIVSP